jgi:type I restriction enzyme S subunit
MTRLGAIASVSSGGTPSRDNPRYWGGSIHWVTTGQIDFKVIDAGAEYITEEGLKNSAAKVVPAGTILMAMFGQGATRGKVGLLGVDAAFNQACVAIVPMNGHDRRLMYHYLADQYDKIRALGQAGTQSNLNASLIRSIPVPNPALEVQQAAGQIFDLWDRAANCHVRLIHAKRRMRDALAAELLTGRHRLPGFARYPWREVPLGEVTRESTRRNGERLGADRVMAVTKSIGLTPMREHTMSDSLARYKVLRPGGFAYNPMRLNIGSIARSSFKRDVLVSPDYVVFEAVPESLDPRFLDYTRRAHAWRRFMMAAGSGGVRIRIYYDDLARLQLTLPDKEEQSAIADILDTAFQEIACLTLLREAVAKQKRGLMQGLLTGKIRIKEDSHG